MDAIPGLTGDVVDYLCDGPVHVDADLALGAAVATVAASVNWSYRLEVPALTDATAPERRVLMPVILAGPQHHGGRVLISRVDRLLWLRYRDAPTVTHPLPTKSRQALLTTWEEPTGWPPRKKNCLIVPRSETNHVASTPLDERVLARRLAAIRFDVPSEVVTWDEGGAKRHKEWLATMWDDATTTEDYDLLEARVCRWVQVCAVLAVGVDHRKPVVTSTIVDVAFVIAARALSTPAGEGKRSRLWVP